MIMFRTTVQTLILCVCNAWMMSPNVKKTITIDVATVIIAPLLKFLDVHLSGSANIKCILPGAHTPENP